MRRAKAAFWCTLLGSGALLLQGCPSSTWLVDDCFSDDTISERQYEDLNGFEQLLYKENDCGRYVERSHLFTEAFDD